MKKLFVVVGPTASGKSRFALRLAKRVDGEIVSFDAMQVYRGVPILTNQPPLKDQRKVPHHLIGFLPLSKEFSAAEFAARAREVIQDILRRGKTPILVGGSGFYLKALLEGRYSPVQAAPAIRKRYTRALHEKGSAYLYEKLRLIDPKRAKAIHPNDAYRLIRALEIYEVTGKKPSEFGEGGGLSSLFAVEKVGIRSSRRALYRRIDRRVLTMVRKGALAEVKKTLRKKLSPTARKIIGLSELKSYLKGEMSLEEATSKMQQATRNYAKRQETWFRRERGIHWITP